MATESQGKVKSIVLWLLSAPLALVFAFAGGSKLFTQGLHHENFAKWGYPGGFVYVVGAIELACAIGLLIPRVAGLAAAGLAVTMLGAFATHVKDGHPEQGIVALILLVPVGFIAFARRASVLRLLKRGGDAAPASPPQP
ncbi:DoxX family protein [Myxococcaceae bacterium GXIMD 01537]